MAKEIREIKAAKGDVRLDAFLSQNYPEFSRTYFKALIKEGAVTVNGAKVKPSRYINDGDLIKVTFPEVPSFNFKKIPFEILYEDKAILAINKPAGLIVHPAGKPSAAMPTLMDILVSKIPRIRRMAEDLKDPRPGIVHRLDKDTSGVMVIAKTPDAARKLSAQFADRSTEKTYIAIVCGIFSEKAGTIDAPVGRDRTNRKKFTATAGRESTTNFKVLKRFAGHTLLEIKPLTGRTHQIRVHLSLIGHPILGDSIYGSRNDCPPSADAARQMLHAKKLTIINPGNNRKISFTAKTPPDFLAALKKLAATALIFCALFCSYARTETETTFSTRTTAAASADKKAKPAENKEIRKLTSEIAIIKAQVDSIYTDISEIGKKNENSEQRIKETNLALADLNRKITEIEASLEKFRSEVKMGAIDEKDKKSTVGALESEQKRFETLEKGVSEKISNAESEIALVKTALAQLQEKVGVSNPAPSSEIKQDEEAASISGKIKKIGSSPWATMTAVLISFAALVIAVSK